MPPKKKDKEGEGEQPSVASQTTQVEQVDMGKIYEAMKVVNQNVEELSKVVNQHSAVINELAKRQDAMVEAGQTPSQQHPDHNGSGMQPNDEMGDKMMDLGKLYLQSRQGANNPFAGLFNKWLEGVIVQQTNMLQANTRYQNAISGAIEETFTKRIAKSAGEKLEGAVMGE